MVRITTARCLVVWICTSVCSCLIVGAHPIIKTQSEADHEHAKLVPRRYLAVTAWENPRNIALAVIGSVTTIVGLGLIGMHETEKAACRAVAQQEATMQASWDQLHPDGFVPAGDQMRPLSFDCKERVRFFRPPHAYTNPEQEY